MQEELNETDAASVAWVKWDKRLELGIPLIDKQHKHLVGMCNELHEALRNRQGRNKDEWLSTVSCVLRQAVEYTKTHFSDEERLMRACRFSNYEQHRQHHREFVQTISKVLADFEGMSLTLGFDFADYLRDWILSHVACEDKQYCPVVRSFYQALKQQRQQEPPADTK